MKVKEIMTAAPAACKEETALQDIARTMVGRDCGSVPVVAADGHHLTGMITDRDMVVRAVAEGKNPLSLTARECMTTPAISVREDASLNDCTDVMEANKIRRVPVVDASGSLVGIVAQADIARFASRTEAGELVHDVSIPGR